MKQQEIPPFLSQTDEGVLLKIHVQPKASRNSIAGIFNGALKIKVQAPPADGAANKACIALLSKLLKVPKSHISIKSGHKSRDKTLKLKGLSIDEAQARLELDV